MSTAGWIVAGYAAAISTASLAWQVISWRLARTDRLKVEVRYVILGTSPTITHGIAVTAVNRSDHAVRVEAVGLHLQDGSGDAYQQFRQPEIATIPGAIASHDSGATYFRLEDVEAAGVDVFKPLTAWVRLSTGRTVGSEATTLRSS